MKTKIISIQTNVGNDNKQQQMMTSLEIAELTGKQHNDVLKAIRKMEPAWVKIAQGKFSLGSYKDGEKTKYLRPIQNREAYLALRNGGEQQAIVAGRGQGPR